MKLSVELMSRYMLTIVSEQSTFFQVTTKNLNNVSEINLSQNHRALNCYTTYLVSLTYNRKAVRTREIVVMEHFWQRLLLITYCIPLCNNFMFIINNTAVQFLVNTTLCIPCAAIDSIAL